MSFVHVKVHETRSHAHASVDEEKVMTRKHKAENRPHDAEQSPKKAKQENDNGETNGKAGESDITDVEFEEFCKAIEANLSIEEMREILEANDQDSSGPDPLIVTKWWIH